MQMSGTSAEKSEHFVERAQSGEKKAPDAKRATPYRKLMTTRKRQERGGGQEPAAHAHNWNVLGLLPWSLERVDIWLIGLNNVNWRSFLCFFRCDFVNRLHTADYQV